MIDPETKQLLRVIAAALCAIAECQGDGLSATQLETATKTFTWLDVECRLLATFRKD